MRIALLSLGLLVAVQRADAQRPLNLGFERASAANSDLPWGWSLGWSAFATGGSTRFQLDTAERIEGKQSLRIEVNDTTTAPSRQLMLQVPTSGLLGRRLRLEGQLKQRLAAGASSVSLEAWGSPPTRSADSLRFAAGRSERWESFVLELRVPADSTLHSIVVSVAAQGRGRVNFDDLVLFVDGQPVSVTPLAAAVPSAQELRALAGRSVPLMRVEAVRDDAGADLVLLDSIVGTARVVGLGESTHGTREFFQVKHRVLAHLVASRGFTVFAIEANQLAVERLNAYVAGGPGTAAEAMRVLFRVWNTSEVLAVVEWMREWNASHRTRPLRFIGYDMQDHRRPVDSLLAFLRDRDPAMVANAERLSQGYRARAAFATPEVDAVERARWHAAADTLAREAATHRERWLAASTTRADSLRVEWAVQSANLFRQAALLNATLNSPDRDSLMASNLAWALTRLYPEERAVVWAHDVHISRGGDPQLSFNGGAQMGTFLSRMFPGDYRAISLLTQRGHYTATRSFTDHTMLSVEAFDAPEGSVEQILGLLPRASEARGLLLDLRGRENPSLGALNRPRPIRHIGYAAYDYGFEISAVLALEFDAVIFVTSTTASRLLP